MGVAVASGDATAVVLLLVEAGGFNPGAGKDGESTIMENGLRGGCPVNCEASMPAGITKDGESTIKGGVGMEGVDTGETLGDDLARSFTGVAVSETGVSIRPAAARDTLNLDRGVFVDSGGSFLDSPSNPRAAAVGVGLGVGCSSGGRWCMGSPLGPML